MAQPLFHVADVFAIEGRGVIVLADIPISRVDFPFRLHDLLEFVGSDGSRLRTRMRGVEMSDPYRPDRPFAFLVGPEIEKADIVPGAEVWRIGAATEP